MVYPFSNGGCVVGYISNTIWQFFLLKMETNVELERIDKLIVLLRELSEYHNEIDDFVYDEISGKDDDYHEYAMAKLNETFSAYFDAIKDNLDMLVVDFAFSSRKKTTTL